MLAPTADLSLTKSASPAAGRARHRRDVHAEGIATPAPTRPRTSKSQTRCPPDSSFKSASAGCTFADGTVTCAAPSLAVGRLADLHGRRAARRSLTVGVVNTATVGSSTADPDPNNNSAIASAPLGPEADLSITKTASTPSLVAGGQVTYTLTVEDNGPSDAAGVVVSDPLPAGQTLVSAIPSQGSCTHRGRRGLRAGHAGRRRQCAGARDRQRQGERRR